MALKILYTHKGTQYPEAYLKISKVISANVDSEFYENQPDGSTLLKWISRPENIAFVTVFPDEDARRRNVRALESKGVFFDFDVKSDQNIYKAAYNSLKEELAAINMTDYEDV